MTSRSGVLLGNAPPRFRVVPPAASNAAGLEMVELGDSIGMVLDPWQRETLIEASGEDAQGKWAASEVAINCDRQNGKGGILEVREIGGLFLLGEWLLTHTAHRVDTCLEHFRRVKTLVEGSSDLTRKVKTIREANGQESIELMSGARLNFKARSKGAGRGFSGDFLGLDEAMWLTDLGSMLPSLSASPNPQIYYVGSAPLPRAESDAWRAIVRRGRRLAVAA